MEQELLRQIVIKVLEKLSACSMTAIHPKPFSIGVSNRHIHLSQKDLEFLFGCNHCIQCQRELSQPGQCAAAETVVIAGPKGCIENVRVLGPVRKQTQVEVSCSDTFKLGLKAPVRESGKLEGSGGVTVIGPKGSLQLKEGLIIAQRHIHMTPLDAKEYRVSDGQKVQVKVPGERGMIFDNVVVRVSDKFALEYHIDTDEANGAGIRQGEKAYILSGNISFDPDNTGIKSLTTDSSKKKSLKPIEEPIGLVTEETVRQALKNNAVLIINKGVICTPLARDTIKELGAEVVWK